MSKHPSCVICFCATPPEQQVTCQDAGCRAFCCKDCFVNYITYCESACEVPVCIGEGCHEWYLFSRVKRQMAHATLAKYVTAVLRCTQTKEGAVVDAKLASKQLVDTLRRERLTFLDSHFTNAIKLVVKVAFQHRMKRIQRSRISKLSQAKQGQRACMTLVCRGFLNPDTFTCMLCRTRFCQTCERIQPEKHACDPNDVASVAMLRQMIHCPKCKTKVERSSGCANMTCAVCNTRFNYRTGLLGGHGSQNAPVAIIERSTLSGTYRDRVGVAVLELLLRFEAKKPKEPSKQPFLTTLMHIKTGKLAKARGALTLCKQIEHYKRLQYHNRCYYQLAQRLEEEVKRSTVDHELVQALVKRL